MTKITVTTEGFRELDQALADLGKVTARNVGRRTLRTVAEPVADRMEQGAPYDVLRRSIEISTKLNPRQARQHRWAARRSGGKSFAELFVGSTSAIAHLWEYGSILHPPKPFGRPAWDAEKGQALDRIGDALGQEIAKAVARAERKAARQAAKAAKARQAAGVAA